MKFKIEEDNSIENTLKKTIHETVLSCIREIEKEINKDKLLNDLGISIEYVDDYEFDEEDWVAVYCADMQDIASEIPLSINEDLLYKGIKNKEIEKEDLPYHIKKSIWHEIGHGIISFTEDVIDIPDWDEERVVEEFAEYMMDETLYSRLVDDVIMEYLEYEE